MTNGKNIDLDASVICLDTNRNEVDLISYKKLTSNDHGIRHGGDEREGDEEGDDEKIFVNLARVNKSIKYIAFVINSFSGQELDDVSKTSCHLFNSATKVDLARYQLSNNRSVDGYTGLVVACLYRDDNDESEWCMRIISEPAHGRYASKLVDEVQRFILKNPSCPPTSPPPDVDIVLNEMPEEVEIEFEPMA